MKIKYSIFLVILFIHCNSFLQEFDWAKQYDDALGGFVATDPVGNALLCYPDKLLKINSSGETIWEKETEFSGQLHIDSIGSIYILGGISSPIDVDLGPEEYWLYPVSMYDKFILKLDPFGNFIWAGIISSLDQMTISDISTDQDLNVFVIGQFEGTMDVDPGPEIFAITSSGEFDSFYVKLDFNGNFEWSHSFGGAGYERGRGISADRHGNCYVAIEFEEIVDFDPGPGFNYIESLGFRDIAIQKINEFGDVIWTKAIGATGKLFVSDIISDGNGHLYICGRNHGLVDMDPGDEEFLLYAGNVVYSLDSDGQFRWANRIRTSITGYSANAAELSLTSSGNLFVTGLILDPPIAELEFGEMELEWFGDYDCFISELDTSGNIKWIRTLGSSEADRGISISADEMENIYITGRFALSVDFDFGDEEYVLETLDAGDLFLLKINRCAASETVTLIDTSCTEYYWPITETYYESAGLYGKYFISSNGCDSILKLNLSLVPNDMTLSFTDNHIKANQDGATYQWLNCLDGYSHIEDATNQLFEPTENGSYAVIIDKYDCVDTSDCFFLENVGTRHLLSSKIKIYPNPFDEYTTIDFGTQNVIDHTIIIHDILGQEVYKYENVSGSSIEIKRGQLEAGVYVLTILKQNSEESFSMKLIVK